MKPLDKWVADYFRELIAACEEKDELAICYLREAILEFLENPQVHTADEVYNSFFDIFRMRKEGFAFFDILDALRTYELQTAGLTENQRDHFTHSVWVFLLGLGLYAGNSKYQRAFRKGSYAFLYQWGLTSLLHDIGYPIEITFNQFKQYVENMVDIDGDGDKPEPYFEYGQIKELLYMDDDDGISFVEYLAENMAHAFAIDEAQLKADLQSYPNIRGTSGYIDHGFYSAIMMMRWHGLLAKKSGAPSDRLAEDIVEAAAAILLHNYYKRPLQKANNLPPMEAKRHPLAFMIILCDELQEWDRAAYGKENKSKPIAEGCEILLDENQLQVTYVISIIEGAEAEEAASKYARKKIETLDGLINLSSVYENLSADYISATVLEERRRDIAAADKLISPRPLLEDLEATAKIIHDNYRQKYPDSQQGSLPWEECDSHFRYDNISQARHLYDYVTKQGYLVLGEAHLPGLRKIEAIDARSIEEFAIAEHDRWVKSKLRDGWRYGAVRDNEQKLHPQLIPYEELTEAEKDKDRAPLIEFVDTLNAIGKSLFQVK